MDINQKIKGDLEGRIKKLEDFIENKGLGSSRLKKAKKMQHNANLALFIVSIFTVAGVTLWALNWNHQD